VFAAPPLAAARGQLDLQNRGRIGEHPVPQRPHMGGQPIRQLLQPLAQHLVVVTPPGINRHSPLERLLRTRQLGFPPAVTSGHSLIRLDDRWRVNGGRPDGLRDVCAGGTKIWQLAGQVVHARGDHAHRAGHQFSRARALEAVVGHVTHAAVEPGGQPGAQTRLGGRQVHPGHANLGKSQFAAPCLTQRYDI
jgi:hypothetical protein